MIGPPIEPEYCLSASGMSTGLIALSVVGNKQLSTDGGQKLVFENEFACQSPGRTMNSPSPCSTFVPDLVTMFNAGPAVQPNSAENAFVRIANSWTAPIGTVAIAVWRPHPSSLFAPSSVKVVVRREPAPVIKYVAFTKRSPVPLPCRNAELRSGSDVTLRPKHRIVFLILQPLGSDIVRLVIYSPFFRLQHSYCLIQCGATYR